MSKPGVVEGTRYIVSDQTGKIITEILIQEK